jgi:hypothetical protein
MDVKKTFLNGIIEEQVYIKKSQGFEVSGKESHVCRLKGSLYGINHALKEWYSKVMLIVDLIQSILDR